MNIKYKILNPGGNKTAIVLGNEYNEKQKKTINNKILKEHKEVEQVGFISMGKNKLEMAGGEFCVNATRCAIWEYLKGQTGEIRIDVSGCEQKITGGITQRKEVYVNMLINKKINNIIRRKDIFNFVDLDGILLSVVNEEDSKKYIKELMKDEEIAKVKIKGIMKAFKTNKDAIGIIFLERVKQKIKIHPVIWVKTVDTLYYETACGSGSLATALYMYYIDGREELEIIQPSGYSINIKLNKKEDCIEKAIITGKMIEEK